MPVTTLSALNSAAAGTAARVIQFSGSLSGTLTDRLEQDDHRHGGRQDHRAHLTLDGSSNVILQNFTVVGLQLLRRARRTATARTAPTPITVDERRAPHLDRSPRRLRRLRRQPRHHRRQRLRDHLVDEVPLLGRRASPATPARCTTSRTWSAATTRRPATPGTCASPGTTTGGPTTSSSASRACASARTTCSTISGPSSGDNYCVGRRGELQRARREQRLRQRAATRWTRTNYSNAATIALSRNNLYSGNSGGRRRTRAPASSRRRTRTRPTTRRRCKPR